MKLRFSFVILLMMLTAALFPTYASAASTPLNLSYGNPATATLEGEGYTWDGLTLTLNSFSSSAGSSNAVSITGVPTNATTVVVLEGKSTLSSSNYALTTSGKLAIEGTGTLSISSGKVSCSGLFTQQGATLNLASGTSLTSSGIIVNRGTITGSGAMSVPSGTLAINFGSGTCAPTIANASTSATSGSISVNTSWIYTLFHSSQSGSGWVWNSDADTLTLSGGSVFRMSSGSLMSIPSDTTVVINGHVVIICDSSSATALALSSSNALQINSGASLTIISSGKGITSTNAVTTTNGALNILSGGAALTVSQGTTTLGAAYLSSGSYGYSASSGGLTIAGASAISGGSNGVNLTGGSLSVNEGAVLFARTSSSGGHAVYTSGNVTVNGAIGLHSAGNGIYAPSGSITLNSGHLVAKVDKNPLLFSNGTFTMSGGTAIISSLTNGIYTPNGIYLSGGADVTISRADHSGAVATSGAITLNGGSTITVLDTGVNAVYASKGITMDAGSCITVGDAGQHGVQVAGGNLSLTNGATITVDKAGSYGIYVSDGALTTTQGDAITVKDVGGNGIYVNGTMTTASGSTTTVTKAGANGIWVRDLADLDGTISVGEAGDNAINSSQGSVVIRGNATLNADKVGIYAPNLITTYDTCTLAITAGTDGVVTKSGAITLACAPTAPMTISAKNNGVVSGSTVTLSRPGEIYISAGPIGVKAEGQVEAGGSDNDTSFLSIESTTYSIYSVNGNIMLLACRDAYLFDYNVYTNSDDRKSMTLGDGAAIFFGMKTGFSMGVVRKDFVLTAAHTGTLMSLDVLQVGNGYSFTIASDATVKTGPIVTGLESVVVAEPGSTVFYVGEEGIVEGETTAYLTNPLDLSTTSDIVAAAATNDSISWDGSTLTLDGLVLAVEEGTALTLPADVTVAVTDTPSLISTGSDTEPAIVCEGDFTISGDGTLMVSGGDTALSVEGDLSLGGSDVLVMGSEVAAISAQSLTVVGGSLEVVAYTGVGIVVDTGISLTDATLSLQADGTALQALGGDVVITDCDVTASASDVAIRAGGEESGRVIATNSTLNLSSDDTAVAAYVGTGSPAGVLQIDMSDDQRIATQDGWAVITQDDVVITALAVDGDEVNPDPDEESEETTIEEEFADLGELTISILEDGSIVAELVQTNGVIVITTITPEGVLQSTITLPEEMTEAVVTIPIPDGDPSALLPVLVGADEETSPILVSVATQTGIVLNVEESCTILFEEPTIYFADVAEGTWYHDAVYYVAYRNLFTGMTQDTYVPDQATTRSELVNALWQLSGAQETDYVASFPDLADDTYTVAVNWCTQQGLIAGIDGNFAPDQSITRQELATFLYRYVQFLGLDTTGRGDLYRYVDGDDVASWAWDATAWAVDEGVLTGRNDGTLDPTGTTTRAEVAAMFQRCVLSMID